MESLIPLIIQLVCGILGGNIAGSLMKDSSLGTVGNSIAGIVGGAAGRQVLGLLRMATGGGAMGVTSIVGSIAGGGVGGAILMAIIGLIKKAIAQK